MDILTLAAYLTTAVILGAYVVNLGSRLRRAAERSRLLVVEIHRSADERAPRT